MAVQAHRSDPQILKRRTLQRDHRRLAAILRPGMSVLDIGCGVGAITEGIAKAVSPGVVAGLDRDPQNLSVAREYYSNLPNLSFEQGDALSLPYEARFDIVNAARTLQWISDPASAVVQMKRAAKPRGRIVALDYNLADNSWYPGVPAEFSRFYRSFLDWRESNQWDNHMADHLPDLFQAAGIEEIEVHVSDETTERGNPGFAEIAGIWSYVTGTLGAQIVAAGFLLADEPEAAQRSYLEWVANGLMKQTLVMRTVEGTVPR